MWVCAKLAGQAASFGIPSINWTNFLYSLSVDQNLSICATGCDFGKLLWTLKYYCECFCEIFHHFYVFALLISSVLYQVGNKAVLTKNKSYGSSICRPIDLICKQYEAYFCDLLLKQRLYLYVTLCKINWYDILINCDVQKLENLFMSVYVWKGGGVSLYWFTKQKITPRAFLPVCDTIDVFMFDLWNTGVSIAFHIKDLPNNWSHTNINNDVFTILTLFCNEMYTYAFE